MFAKLRDSIRIRQYIPNRHDNPNESYATSLYFRIGYTLHPGIQAKHHRDFQTRDSALAHARTHRSRLKISSFPHYNTSRVKTSRRGGDRPISREIAAPSTVRHRFFQERDEVRSLLQRREKPHHAPIYLHRHLCDIFFDHTDVPQRRKIIETSTLLNNNNSGGGIAATVCTAGRRLPLALLSRRDAQHTVGEREKRAVRAIHSRVRGRKKEERAPERVCFQGAGGGDCWLV